MIERSELSGIESTSNRDSAVRLTIRLHRIKLVARRYWWIVALAIMIGLGIQDYRCLKEPARYVSSSQMMVSGHLSLPEQVYSEDYPTFFGTQVALMQSRETLVPAIDRVSTLYPDITVDPSAEITASVEPRTSIFDLRATSINAEYAKVLLDEVMNTYLESKRGRKNQTSDEAVSAITEEISHLDAEIRNDEQELLNFQSQHDVVFIEQQSESTATYLVGLNKELAELTKEQGLLDLEIKDPLINPEDYAKNSNPDSALALTTGNNASAPATGNNATATGDNAPVPGTGTGTYSRDSTAILAEQDYIEKLKILRNDLGVYLKDKHPKMVNLTDTIDKEQKFLDLLKSRNVVTRDEYREDLGLQIRNLKAQIQTWNDNSLKLSESLGTYQQLKDKINREQTLYNQLASSIQTVKMNESVDQDYVIIMQAASNAKPIDPNYPMQMIYGVVGGLLAGLAIIYFVNRLDDKIDSPLELEENINYPIIGQIPLQLADKTTKRVPLLTEGDQRRGYLEHHRSIRSAILFRSTETNRPRSLMVCSAAPGEGKSSLAANLAFVFAHSGARTLLIDADLRRGIQHTLFNLPISPGLADHLLGKAAWRDVVHATHLANLDVILRGKVPHRAGDLFLVSEIDQLIEESMAEYDMVLWDTVPLLAANDAANLCSRIEGVLFVARVRYSTINSVHTAMDELSKRNAKILGVVLNAVEPHQPGYHDKYRYQEYFDAELTT